VTDAKLDFGVAFDDVVVQLDPLEASPASTGAAVASRGELEAVGAATGRVASTSPRSATNGGGRRRRCRRCTRCVGGARREL
jgi:hypothetical protein